MSSFNPCSSRLAADLFETCIESQILRPDDLYDLDGETFLRSHEGRIETAYWEVDQ